MRSISSDMRVACVIVIVIMGLFASAGCARHESPRLLHDAVPQIQQALGPEVRDGHIPKIPIPHPEIPIPRPETPPIGLPHGPLTPGTDLPMVLSPLEQRLKAELDRLASGDRNEKIVKKAACSALQAAPDQRASHEEWKRRIEAEIPGFAGSAAPWRFAVDKIVDRVANPLAGLDAYGGVYLRVCGF